MEKETENKVSQVKPQKAANKSKSSAKKSKPKNTYPQKQKKVSSNAEELKKIQDVVDEQLKVSQDNVENGTHNKVPEPKVVTEEKVEKKKSKKESKDIKKEKQKGSEKSLQTVGPKEIYSNNAPQPKKVKSHVGVTIGLSFVFLALVALILCSFMFALVNRNSVEIIEGVSIMGVDVSHLSKEDAIEKVTHEIDNRLAQNLVFTHHDERYQIIAESLEVKYNVDEVVDKAYTYGRTGNIFVKNLNILKTKYNKINITPETTSNNEIFDSIVEQMETNFADCLKQAEYEINGTKLTIRNGKDGYTILKDELKDILEKKYTAINFDPEETVEVPVSLTKMDSIDIAKIYQQIYKPAIDATYTQEPYKITASEEGLDFKISLDEAKSMISEKKDSYEIPLKVLYPNVTTDDISKDAFPDLLAEYSTNYASSNYNRATNVELCAKFMNGKVVMPGDTLSYNKTVGPRTPGRGFKAAPIYNNGTTEMGYGGGSCQVSTTLYNAVLLANLGIVERHNHMFVIGYAPIGRDATVSYGGCDFVFKNTRKYPIKLEVTTYKRNVYVKVYGHKEEVEYDVKITSSRTGTVSPKTTYQTDKSLAPGETRVISGGSAGATAVAYRTLYLNGQVVEKQLLSSDRYQAHNKIVARNGG